MTSALQSGNVRSAYGVPTAEYFANSTGTPLYIDLDTGIAYYLDAANTVHEVIATLPVDAVYTTTDNTDPATILGYGTWSLVYTLAAPPNIYFYQRTA